MSARIYLEGGGGSKLLKSRCREGFRRLFEKCGFSGRMPRLVASGARRTAFEDFETAHTDPNNSEFVAMLIDSEDPLTDIERTWDHLRRRDGWSKPANTTDDQVLFMTTTMESWIAADRSALNSRFGRNCNENRLPALPDLENRTRDDIFNALRRATGNRYSKTAISFELLGSLNPETLDEHLPSFRRARRILNDKLRD